MLHFTLALLLAQGVSADLWKTDPDPFTDESRIFLSAEGKNGELTMHITCNEDGFNFRFSFPDLKSRPSLSFLKLRFDDMPIETYSILPLLNFISLGFSTNEKGHGIVTNDADLLTRRLPGHKRLRVSLIAKNPSRRVVEEFDISEVTAETLNFMLETECTQNPDPRVLTPEEAQALVDEIGIAEE